MRRPSQPIARKILRAAQDAGWTVTASSIGWKLSDPADDTRKMHLHTSYGDRRAERALRSKARRLGLLVKS